MEEQGKEKQKKKRKVSFFTVFLWLLLIVVMTVITINGIVTQNAVEDSDVLRIRVKVEGLETEEIKEAYQNLNIQAVQSSTVYATFNFIEQDNEGYYIYEASKDFISNLEVSYEILFEKVHIDGYAQEIESDEFTRYSYDYYYDYSVRLNEDVDYIAKITYMPEAKIKVNLKIEGTTDEEVIEQIYKESWFTFYQGYERFSASFSNIEDGVAIYIADKIIPNSSIRLFEGKIYYLNSSFMELPREYQINGEKIVVTGNSSSEQVNLGEIAPGEVLEINVTAYYMLDDTTNVSKSVKWIDKDIGKAQIELGYTSVAILSRPVKIEVGGAGTFILYQDTLSNEFELSVEYQNDSEWSTLDTISEEQEMGIPLDIFNEVFKVEDGSLTAVKKYVYVKDSNTIYWVDNHLQLKNGSTYINVIYKDYEKLNPEIHLESNQEANLLYYGLNQNRFLDKYNISSPKLKFSHTADVILKVNKLVQGEEGTHTHYVGIFEDDTSNKTDQVYEIITTDGEGNITIELEDKDKTYYVYDVDKNGNKIMQDGVKYSKDKIEFEGYIRESKIETDSQVVSSVISGDFDGDKTQIIETEYDYPSYYYYFESPVEETKGAGEEKYVDNVLNVKDIYQEDIVISSKAMKLNVTYIAEEGGSLEGEKEEIVDPGNTPEKVPTPKAEEGYQFVRWEVEENGERIEVNPNEYVIMKDTVFYAIFEKVPVDVDTSDIQVWIYVGVALVAVIVIVLVVVILRKNKLNKKI